MGQWLCAFLAGELNSRIRIVSRICSFAGYSSHPIRKFIRKPLPVYYMVRCDWPSVLRIPPSHSCGNPSQWHVIGDEYGVGRIVCLPARVGRTVKLYLDFWAWISSLTVLRSKWVVGFAWFGLALALWISAHGKRLSSQLFITYHHHSSASRNLTTFSTLKWK